MEGGVESFFKGCSSGEREAGGGRREVGDVRREMGGCKGMGKCWFCEKVVCDCGRRDNRTGSYHILCSNTSNMFCFPILIRHLV